MVEFVCKSCVNEGGAKSPCYFRFKKGMIDYERPDWEKALQLCPFRNSINDKFTDVLVFAKWEKI